MTTRSSGRSTGPRVARPVIVATFGAGRFWTLQHAYDQVKGVTRSWTGYMGGIMKEPTYEDVRRGDTGHVEVVHMEFDPRVVSYETLLDIFWQIHDPTQLNRQGQDKGTQYRSVIFTHDEGQAAIARASKARIEASGKFARPVVTTIEPAGVFWEAEDYHQKYMERVSIRSWVSNLFRRK